MRLKTKSKESPIFYLETERREIITTDITYRPFDFELLKKYFPSIYKDVINDSKLIKRSKGSIG